ncbi:MAG: CoA-binding protein, partial [Campylobacter sp.]|nr:CoA-binding protein [Campylobacter sp.]
MIEEILKNAKNIAIVGLSPDEEKDSNRVAKYLISQNLNIFPIYPKFDE